MPKHLRSLPHEFEAMSEGSRACGTCGMRESSKAHSEAERRTASRASAERLTASLVEFERLLQARQPAH